MKLKYSTTALVEMDRIADYIQQDSPRSALRFLEAVEKTCLQLLDFPELGARLDTEHPDPQGLRVRLVTGFEKHLVIYRYQSDEESIERVVHGARDLPNILEGES